MRSSCKRQGLRPAPGVLVLLLLAATLLSACGGNGNHAQAPPPSTPLVPLTPQGASSYPFTFSWSGVGAADVVHITVVDAAERQLMEFDARGTSAPMPPRLSELIRPGERFSWRVATSDEGGEATRASEWVAVTRER